jgi:hypothetical protein
VKLRAGILTGIRLQLRMADGSHVLDVITLVESNLLSRDVLNMSDSTVGKLIPFHLEVTKHLLEFLDHLEDGLSPTSEFEVINMLGHDDPYFPISLRVLSVIEAQLWVSRAGNQPTLAFSDLTKFHAESTGCINKASARLVTMKDFGLGIKVSNPGNFCNRGTLYAGR